MDQTTPSPILHQLQTAAVVQERPFFSTTPFIGPLIARFRTAWNNIATRWYVLPLVAQQNQYNLLLANHIHVLHEQIAHLNGRLLPTDHAYTQLTHDLAEMTAQLTQTNRLLQAIEQRLHQLEEK